MYICVTISRSATDIRPYFLMRLVLMRKNRSRFLPQGFVHLAKLISATASTGNHRCSLLGFEEKRFFVPGNSARLSVKYMWDLYYPLSGFPIKGGMTIPYYRELRPWHMEIWGNMYFKLVLSSIQRHCSPRACPQLGEQTCSCGEL